MRNPASRPIRVGHIGLSFHDVSAREVEAVLEKHGHTIERVTTHHEEMFEWLGQSKVDLLCAAWLPSSHQKYLDPIEDQVRKVTALYEPYCIWGVPEHVPESAVSSVEDLLDPTVLEKMNRLIQGINPGAGISRFSKAIVEEYGLAAEGYHFESGSEADCFDRFEDAVASGDWVVIPLWHPQYLHARYKIRALEEPKGLLGSEDQATLLIRRDVEELVGSAALDELSALHLGNERVSALDFDHHEALKNGAS